MIKLHVDVIGLNRLPLAPAIRTEMVADVARAARQAVRDSFQGMVDRTQSQGFWGAAKRSVNPPVIRDNKLQKEPTVGQVPLVSGEIAEDITSYYAYSEQIPTVCALGVLVDKDLSIACAGGYLLQLLPGATDAEITRLEQNIAAMPSVTEMLRAGKTPQDMMELAMAGFDPQVLDTREVKYQCDCSKERTKDMLLSLGRKELVKLRDEDPKCEVVCHFCHTKYEFDLNELLAETTPEEK